MSVEHDNFRIDRRLFFKRCLQTGAAVTVTCVGGLYFFDSSGPQNTAAIQETYKLPDFAIPQHAGKMAVVKGADRVMTVNEALKALGGIEQFIQKGDRVLIKVNAAFASPALLSATSDPQLVGEVIRLCLKAGAQKVVVTDNPINDPTGCFALTGIERAVQTAGGELILPNESYFEPVSLTGARLIRDWPLLFKPFEGINKLIGVAPVKDHHRSGASMTMKNWYGLLGGRRNIFHQDIHTIIKELAMMVSPTLVILDGTVSMMSNGPTGGSMSDLKSTHTMIVSTDQVAADAFGATLLGKTIHDLPFIQQAEKAGAGTADYRKLNPVIL